MVWSGAEEVPSTGLFRYPDAVARRDVPGSRQRERSRYRTVPIGAVGARPHKWGATKPPQRRPI
eukprot:11600462-Prorocentrum_lima.AAC.1